MLGGDQRPFEEARAEERDALRRLRGAAAGVAPRRRQPGVRPTLDRVVATLRAAAATEDGRTTLREGRLSEEPEPSGFEALAGLGGAKPKRRPARARQGPTAADRRRARSARRPTTRSARPGTPPHG